MYLRATEEMIPEKQRQAFCRGSIRNITPTFQNARKGGGARCENL